VLKEYRKKRDFRKTTEPAGKAGQKSKRKRPFFVVQQHDSSTPHYDFRFLHQGVLKSWALPKGPSLLPGEKRLAIATEDHPVEYAAFEGVIPEDAYGAGTVLVWDEGKFKAREEIEEGFRKGKLSFELKGEKLEGAFELVRFRKGEDQWLLIKHQDKHARDKRYKPITEERPCSVKTGRDLDEVREDAEDENPDVRTALKDVEGARKGKLPQKVKPLLPTLVEKAPQGEEWLHEVKWDGYRLLAEKKGGKVRLLTRNRKDWTGNFPALARSIDKLCEQDFLIDGEVVVLDPEGKSDFQRLQNRMKSGKGGKLRFCVFDVLYLGGQDLRKTPLEERKDILRHWLYERCPKYVLLSDHTKGDGGAFAREACREELEGVVSKKAESVYRSGRRRSWVKSKCGRRQEFVIAGYTEPSGSRLEFGSLLLAGYNAEGKLAYAGRVGTSFSQETLEEVGARLRQLERKTSPLESNTGQAPGKAHWVTPKLIAEVAYTEVTGDGLLRHPVFHGLREDKRPGEVRLEWETGGGGASNGREGSGSRATKVAGVSISHPERVIDPDTELTKEDLARYYATVAEAMLPYLKGRPLSFVRCPRGRQKACFFQKHFDGSAPEEIERVILQEKQKQGSYALVKDAAGLVALAQYGVIEFHGFGCRVDATDKPDQLIFDLDPGSGVEWEEVVDAACLLREKLDSVGLKAFPKLTGGKGLHVCVPLARRAGWDEARAFCRDIANALVVDNSSKLTAEASKDARKGKVYVDYLRNSFGAIAVLPFSARARPGLPGAAPLSWNEVNDVVPNKWRIENMTERLKGKASKVWQDYAATRQQLSKARLKAFAKS